MGKRALFVCGGSNCRKALKKRARVREAIEGLPANREVVRCQRVCRGPVVGVEVEGTLQWFERVDSLKAVGALRDLIEAGAVSKPLRKRRNAKRAGRRRT